LTFELVKKQKTNFKKLILLIFVKFVTLFWSFLKLYLELFQKNNKLKKLEKH